MKKLLALVLGIAFLLATPAARAASPIEFEGYVKVYHESLSNFLRTNDGNYLDRDNFFGNRLQVSVTFRPADNIKVFWQFRGPDYQRWGITSRNPDNQLPAHLFTRALYGEVTFPWGTIQGGRVIEGNPGTSAGLSSLGYAPSWGKEYRYANPFNSGDPLDSITYKVSLDNGLGFSAFYGKQQSFWGSAPANYPFENPANPNPAVRLGFKDSDYDLFGMEGVYKWQNGGASLAVSYHRDMTGTTVDSDRSFYINPAFTQSWGEIATGGRFSVNFEGKFGWGKRSYADSLTVKADDKTQGYGFYLDGVYEYQEGGNVTLASWYVSGTDKNNPTNPATKNNSLVTLGDFAPFLVAQNGVTLGHGTYSNNVGGVAMGVCDPVDLKCADNNGRTNQWAIAILGNHAITPEISFNYGLGYFHLAKTTAWIPVTFDQAKNLTTYVPQSKDLGWEIDLGMTFKLLDNLTFETSFGYMFNGDAFNIYQANPTDPAKMGSFQDPKDTFAWANVLAFSF
jgi:hypothetical protein